MKIQLIIVLLSTVMGLKVKERFKGKSFNDDLKCKILGFKAPNQDMFKAANIMFGKMADYFTKGYSRFNSCHIDNSISEINLGTVINHETGEYSGITGLVQKDKYQSAALPFKAAARPYEPVKVGPVIMPADMAIISFRPGREEERVQLEQFIYEFDPITYTFIALIIIVVSLNMSVIMYVESWLNLRAGRRVSIRKFLKRSINNLHNILVLLINQILTGKMNEANKIIWISVVFFVFVLIFNLFLSLIRSSYVVTRQPPFIETLSDFIESNVTPITFKGVYYEDAFRLSTEPQLQEVYKRLVDNRTDNFIMAKFDFDPKTMEKGMPIFERIRDRKAAFFIDSGYVKLWKSGMCNFIHSPMDFNLTTELLSRFTSTRQLLAPGLLSTMFSPKIDPFLYKYVHYYFITSNELGLFDKLMHDSKYTLYFEDDMGNGTEWDLMKCVDASERVSEDIDDHKQLDVENISNFLITIARLFALSIVVLVIEITIYFVITKSKNFNKRRKFRKVATWTLVNR